jgi:prephenate dehydrogenase
MKKVMFDKICIIGVGLIGGSIGLASKKKKLAKLVVGLSRHQSSLDKAIKKKAIDEGCLELDQAVKDADLIIIAVPVSAFKDVLIKIKPFLKEGCIVSEVTSTKVEIIKLADKILPKGIKFVATHPMAGSEKRGVEFAKGDLFKDSTLIITPTSKTDKASKNKISCFWRKLGAKVISISPKRHDQITASISHLPHAIAVALMNTVKNNDLQFAAGGFKDVSRIAQSPEAIWQSIFETNKKEVVRQIGKFVIELEKLKKAIKNSNTKNIKSNLRNARKKRSQIKN